MNGDGAVRNPVSTFLRNDIYQCLDDSLDLGLSEHQFWEMTIAELGRWFKSRKRVIKQQAQEKATWDYILANLIGASVYSIFNKSSKMPDIEKVYPNLFDAQEIEAQKQQKQDELSAARFRQFAEAFNRKFERKEDAK